MQRLSILTGDISHSDAEAIVTVTNSALPDEFKSGCAKLATTSASPAKYVIHALAPTWLSGGRDEAALLASCYRSCLMLATEHKIRTIDLPSIPAGVCGYPLSQAATIALRTIMEHLAEHDLPECVRIVCQQEEVAQVYRQVWNLWYAESKADRM